MTNIFTFTSSQKIALCFLSQKQVLTPVTTVKLEVTTDNANLNVLAYTQSLAKINANDDSYLYDLWCVTKFEHRMTGSSFEFGAYEQYVVGTQLEFKYDCSGKFVASAIQTKYTFTKSHHTSATDQVFGAGEGVFSTNDLTYCPIILPTY